MYDVASSLKAKVSSVLKEKSYVWKPLRSISLLSIQSKLPLTDIGDVDRPYLGSCQGGHLCQLRNLESNLIEVIGG